MKMVPDRPLDGRKSLQGLARDFAIGDTPGMGKLSSAPSRRPMQRDLLGALAIWSFSLPGLIFSILLTVLKFRSDHLCDASAFSVCSGSYFGCGTVFHDPLARLWGLPLTIYAAAFYLVAATLAALLLLNPGRLRATLRPILLLLAWAGIVVVMGLGGYTAFALTTVCLYCAFLYLTNLGLLLAVLLMHPGGTLAGLRPLRRLSETTVVLAVAALGFVTAVMAQRTFYILALDANPHALGPCITHLNQLEPTTIALRPTGVPRLAVALFLDLDCPHCRDDFKLWQELIAAENAENARIELRIYQFPRDPCDPHGGKLDASGSCNAARALLCLTGGLATPEMGLTRIDRLFALQYGPAPHFSNTHLAEVARSFGVDADAERPVADDPLFACMQSQATSVTLHRHQHLAQRVAGLVAPPGALLIPLTAGRPTGRAMQIHGRKPRSTLLAWIHDNLPTDI